MGVVLSSKVCLEIIFFIQVFQLNVLVYNGYLVFIGLRSRVEL